MRQVLLSQVHRMRALLLLGRFVDMGSWAVDLALSVGIFPYVLKLLQTTATDLRQILVFIWTKILALDKSCQVRHRGLHPPPPPHMIGRDIRMPQPLSSCSSSAPLSPALFLAPCLRLAAVGSWLQVDLVKDNGHLYFIKFLDSSDPAITPSSRAMAAFVLAVICDNHSKGQMLCANSGLLGVCLSLLPPPASAAATGAPTQLPTLLCLLLLHQCTITSSACS